MIRPLVKLLRQVIGWPLEAAILYPLVGILRLMPVQTASFLSGALFGTLGPISPWHKRVLFNIGYAMPETSASRTPPHRQAGMVQYGAGLC